MEPRPTATAESILSRTRDKPYEINVDGESVFLLPIKAIALRDLQKESSARPKRIGEDDEWCYRVLMVTRFVCDSDGARIFQDADYDKISSLEPAYMIPLVHAVLSAYGLAPEEVPEGEESPEVGKSVAIPSSDSG